MTNLEMGELTNLEIDELLIGATANKYKLKPQFWRTYKNLPY